jgi:hypothetical protein
MSKVNFGGGFIVVEGTWAEVKDAVDTRSLQLQSVLDTSTDYPYWSVFAVDDSLVFNTVIYSGSVPPVADFDQTTNDANRAEFETITINKRLGLKQQADKALLVTEVGREGKETIWSTHNYCDRTTWFGDSVRVTEVLADSGDSLTFSGSHPYWIDMVHGKVFDEDSLRTDVDHGYDVSVVVADVTQSMRAPFAASGGDYTVNYASGTITFASPVYTPVTGSYSYENGSTWYLRPYEGKAIDLEQAEAQFSVDCDMNDTIHFTVYGLVDVFAPQYLIENGGPYPSGTKIPLEETVYKTIYTLIDEALGSYPVIPALGSNTNPRMNPAAVYGFPFTYNAVRRLSSLYGLELRVYLENHEVYSGNRATATFYCVTRELSDT